MRNLEKIAERDRRELAKWQRASAKKPIKGYLAFTVAILCLIRLMDEFATSSGNSVQSWVVNEFYVLGKGLTYEEGLSRFGLINTATMFVAIFTLFYIALSDVFGRKKMLVVSVLGMTVGLLLCHFSTNLIMYVLGISVLFFFTSTDIHQIYIMEIAPTDKRATYVTLTTTFGCIGTMLIALARRAFTVNDVLIWRNVYFVPALVGIVAVILIIVFCRETNPFIALRTEYLSKSYEQRQSERERAKKEKAISDKESGIGAAFRYIFKEKQVRRVFICSLPNGLAMMAFAYYYESIMTQSGMSTNDVSAALFIYPLAMAVVAFFCGRAADKFGRRPTCIVLSILALAGLTAFILAAENGLNPYLIGLFFGIALSSYYRFGDLLSLTMMELLPTSIRASSSVCRGLFSLVITTIGSTVCAVLIGMFKVTTVCLIWGFVIQSISAIMFFFMAKETKGVELK